MDQTWPADLLIILSACDGYRIWIAYFTSVFEFLLSLLCVNVSIESRAGSQWAYSATTVTSNPSIRSMAFCTTCDPYVSHASAEIRPCMVPAIMLRCLSSPTSRQRETTTAVHEQGISALDLFLTEVAKSTKLVSREADERRFRRLTDS